MLESLRAPFTKALRNITGNSRISEDNVRKEVESIKIALLEADVNIRVVRRFVNHTLSQALDTKVLHSVSPGQQFVKILQDRLIASLGGKGHSFQPKPGALLFLLGLQGSGKTSTAAKLAKYFKSKGTSVFLIAADPYRPAAEIQLRVLAEGMGVQVHGGDKDVLKTTKEGISRARALKAELIIVDTAGRTHADAQMLSELKTLCEKLNPDHRILVTDAMTGQIAAEIAKKFHETTVLDGVILSKFDSDTRGGAALSIAGSTELPILFSGIGETVDDLEVFHPERIASRILGMGDVTTLVEKAQQSIDKEEAVALQKKMRKATLTLNDYLVQCRALKRLGSVDKVMEMLPDDLRGSISAKEKFNDADIKREESIILSMTEEERENFRIISPSRRRRIAKGAGMTVVFVHSFLKKFAKARVMMKKIGRNIAR